MMEEGLAAVAVSGSKASGTYGDGSSNTIRSAYGGLLDKKKKDVVAEDTSKPKEFKSYSEVRG
jgi:hypothetical protein